MPSGFERAYFCWGGKGIARVPVPVRSGRCSPFWRMSRIRFRYWYSSWGLLVGGEWTFDVVLAGSKSAAAPFIELCSRFADDIVILV